MGQLPTSLNSEEKTVASEGHRVLLVDDNPTNLEVLYEALEQQGYELLIAQTGEEALELVPEAHPDLILLDINMPGMDGFETCRRLKADVGMGESVVIFLSARDQVQDKILGLQLGAVDYISKPFEFEEVVARVHTQLALKRAREDLAAMKAQVDALLLNILPEPMAERLKAGEENPVERLTDASIVFADIASFTRSASGMGPDVVVGFLNRVFLAMDALVEKHGMEKIKTVGDAYMAACGVPEPCAEHAERAAAFACDLLGLTREIHWPSGASLGLRIGLATGPVVAGVIGRKKFAYDVWGDTVNTAARMQGLADINQIYLCTEHARGLASGYRVQDRGEMEVKGKGMMCVSELLGPVEA